MKKTPFIVCAIAGLTSVASAQFVVPTATESATDSGVNAAIRNAARSYEAYYAALNNTLTEPFTITGMQFRLAIDQRWRPSGYVPNTWPNQNLTFTDYRIELSKASAGLISDGGYLALSQSFASYQDTPVVVRTGPLTIPAGSFDGTGSGVHPWGPVINFTTSYTINPGESIVVLIRQPSYTPSGQASAFLASKAFVNGSEDAISNTTSATAVNPNNFTSPLFIQFVPEPATMALVGLGLVGLIRRKR